jgi:hypothetical protein
MPPAGLGYSGFCALLQESADNDGLPPPRDFPAISWGMDQSDRQGT